MTRHDFTPYWSRLQVLPRADGTLEIAHHFADVRVGDEIVWGAGVFEGASYRVIEVLWQEGLDDFWVARVVRQPITCYLLGAPL
jgi:hypothetical protein